MWYLPVALRLVVANGLFPFVIKKVVGQHSRAKRFVLQYVFCAVLALVFAAFLGGLNPSGKFGILVVIGVANAFGTFCQWQAIAISLSKTSLFTFLDDIIAVFLAFVILGETKFLNTTLYSGVTLAFAALIFLGYKDYRAKRSENNGLINAAKNLALYFYILAYSLIWGVADFAVKYFAVNKMPPHEFLIGWYGGSLVGAIIIFVALSIKKMRNGDQQVPLSSRNVCEIALLSTLVFVSLGLAFWSMIAAPLVVVQPIFFIGEMILPAIIGLIVFKESKKLSSEEWICFTVAAIGGILVAIGYGGGK